MLEHIKCVFQDAVVSTNNMGLILSPPGSWLVELTPWATWGRGRWGLSTQT